MAFTEMEHAGLIGCYYRALVRHLGEKGLVIFRACSWAYGEKRGRRMARRAQKHGFALDYFAYLVHSEWAPTRPEKAAMESKIEGADFVSYNYYCPWYEAFVAADAQDCAQVYCKIIDKALVRGFHPELSLMVESFIHNTPCCTFRFKEANFKPADLTRLAEEKEKYKSENIRSFAYHTAHVDHDFMQTIKEMAGPLSDEVIQEAHFDFKKRYGEDLEGLRTYGKDSFEAI